MTIPDYWPHQTRALDWVQTRDSGLLALPMSAGKTRIVVEHLERRNCRRVLVLCPLSVTGVWPRETRTWARHPWTTWSGEVTGTRGRPLAAPTIDRRTSALVDQCRGHTGRLLVAINLDAFWRPPMLQQILSLGWDALIVDESHRIQAPAGKASRAAARIAHQIRADHGLVLGLTGTPFGNDGFALWGQMRTIAPGTLPTSFRAFQHQYGEPRRRRDGTPLTTPYGTPIYQGIQPGRRQDLLDRCSGSMLAVTAREVDEAIGLEAPTEQTWTCEADPVTRRAHDQLERNGITTLPDGEVTAANAMVAMLRAAQITSGLAPIDGTDPRLLHHHLTDAPKARLLDDLLTDIGPEPVIVFGRFRHDLDVIRELARRHGRTYGELSGRRRDALAPDATLHPDVQIAGVQLQSGGVGIDLTRARHAIWYALDFSVADHQQARKRIHRAGQQRHVHLHHLAVADTIDETIARALQGRENVIDQLICRLANQDDTKAVAA